MKVLITGTARGIGRAIALEYLNNGHDVIGFDLLPSSINHDKYTHFISDVRCKGKLPDIKDIEVLINNAGVFSNSKNDIETNLLGLMNVTIKYGYQDKIKSIINIASSSASSGSEFPYYVASKGGVLAYTKHTALDVAKYGATCNSISPGGVITSSNDHILNDGNLYDQVLNETILNKWCLPEEIAKLAYYLGVYNKSMTGQDLLVDNGEQLKANFIW